MSRVFSLTSSSFSAASVVLLVLGLLVLGGPTAADEPILPDGDGPPVQCTVSNDTCPGGVTDCSTDHCCLAHTDDNLGIACCNCQNSVCIDGEVCGG